MILLYEVQTTKEQVVAFVIIIRALPNFIRIMYNQGNMKVASVSGSILEKALSSKYIKNTIGTEIDIISDNGNYIKIKCNDYRYLNEITILKGFSIVTGPSGSGKTVLMRNLVDELRVNGLTSLFFSKDLLGDELGIELLAKEINNRISSDIETCGFDEIKEIVTRKINGQKISTGEAERLILFFASYVDADLIILDEFLINIEDSQKEKYINLLLKRRSHVYTILVTHDKFLQKNEMLKHISILNEAN